MILVYKSTSGVDNVANDEIKDKSKQGLTNHNLLKGLKFQNLVMVLENLGWIMVEQDKYHTLSIRDN